MAKRQTDPRDLTDDPRDRKDDDDNRNYRYNGPLTRFMVAGALVLLKTEKAFLTGLIKHRKDIFPLVAELSEALHRASTMLKKGHVQVGRKLDPHWAYFRTIAPRFPEDQKRGTVEDAGWWNEQHKADTNKH